MTFKEDVLRVIILIPEGKVSTYGQIASLSGHPGAARQVGYVLRSLSTEEKDLPWWRVINSKGYISINETVGGYEKNIQAEYLRDEGITVSDKYVIDLKVYLWIGNIEDSRTQV